MGKACTSLYSWWARRISGLLVQTELRGLERTWWLQAAGVVRKVLFMEDLPTMPGRRVIPYYRWEEPGIKKFRNLLQVTQLMSNRTQLWAWISATPAYFPPPHSASYSSPSMWSRKCLVPIASHWAWSAASSRCVFSGVSHLPLPPFWSREFVYVEAACGHGMWPWHLATLHTRW